MRVDLFDFELPEQLIALRPARPRDSARLLHAPASGGFEDRLVGDAPRLISAGDLLVFNDTRVIPARLRGVRIRDQASAAVEATLIKRLSSSSWTVLAKPGKRLRTGDRIRFGAMGDHACLLGALDATVMEKGADSETVLAFDLSGPDLDAAIAAIGNMPLPPYIAGRRLPDEQDNDDYQTVYAEVDGAVASPTAGLHFTAPLLAELDAAGVERVCTTLHVGAGTFLPVKADDTGDHRMHGEWRCISQAAADKINAAKAAGRRVIAVGTTSLRSLESAVDETGRLSAAAGDTSIFITPGYRFRVVDGLWTNFHLPRSTLFMLVSAFVGLDRAKAAYAHAIASGYRFYSYGDASLLWRRSAESAQ
jgi:S-adenosylmethionine:tRNA ribosyltransferase-isomerase